MGGYCAVHVGEPCDCRPFASPPQRTCSDCDIPIEPQPNLTPDGRGVCPDCAMGYIGQYSEGGDDAD